MPMDKEEKSQKPKCVSSEDALRDALEKYSNVFKEPEGMTSICLNDATIPQESKYFSKYVLYTAWPVSRNDGFKTVNFNKRVKRLVK